MNILLLLNDVCLYKKSNFKSLKSSNT